MLLQSHVSITIICIDCSNSYEVLKSLSFSQNSNLHHALTFFSPLQRLEFEFFRGILSAMKSPQIRAEYDEKWIGLDYQPSFFNETDHLLRLNTLD
jgi:hypothetical protein